MQKAKKTVTAAKPGPTGSSRQALGDLHLKLAVEYERALRAVWFLNLRDKPGTTLEAFQGEDGKLTDPDGTVTFRQVKKRDVASAWRLSADDFKRLVQNALNEVAAGDHVVFEFYTNGRILPDLVEITDRGTVLRAGHPDIAAMLAGRDPRLCSRVVFFEHHGHTDPRHLEGQIRWALEDMVRADNPTALALAIVNVEEIAILAQKLLAAEPLLINQGKVTWQDVDAMIGYQSYLATVRACLLGGQALLPIADLDALDAQLPEDAGDVLKAIREGRSIPRERIEAEILQDLQSWFAAPTRAPIRGALVLGAHGSGRTHLLMRLLAQLTKEPGLQLHIASSIDPDPNVVVPALGIERKHPLVLLIDDASEEWISILSAPSGYFRRVYFVATSASPKMAPDLEYLVRQRGSDLHLLELPPSLSAEEATALARVLRPVLPSATELAAAMQTNIRGAVEILANEGCLALVGELGELANDLRDVVTPILACSAMGVVIPRSLLERRFGRALPRELVPYVVTLRRRGTDLIVYESSAVSTKLLHDLLGTARSAVVHYHLGELIENVDPAQKEDRRLARHLLRALWAHDQEAGRSLLRDRKRKFLLILKKEGVHALAFSWLPMVSGIDAELFDACFRPLSQDPSTAAEFALFLRYYGVAEAAKLLQEQLRTRSDWDGWLLAEAGNMIVRLPLPEQREIGRRYTQMLFDLPARMFFEASTRNAFTTMMRLLGDHGIPYDRIRAMNLANEFFLFRVADGLPVTSNWVEAYLNLCNRALRQERHRLSLEVARHLVLDQGHPNHARGAGHFQEAYQRLLEKEARARFDGILRTGLNLLNDVTDFRRLLGEVNVPTNILRLVAAWGTPVQKSEIAALFVAYVEAVANKAPLDRMSAFLSSGFRLVGLSGSAELQRRFLAAILLWLLEHRALPESEQAKFAFYVLRQTVGGLFDDDLVARSRELLMKSIFDPSAGLAMWNGVLAHLCRLTNVPYAPVSSAPWPPLPDWSPNILMPYLRSVNAIHVQEGATEFATRLWERWHAAQWVSAFEFGFVISSLGLVEEALALVEPSTNVPDRRVAALSAVAVFELRRGRRVEAYDAFRKSVEEGDTARYRVSPRQAYAVQKEFERLGEPVLAPLHRMVAALVYDGRLTSLEN